MVRRCGKFRWEINERLGHAISVCGIGPIRSAETKLLHMSRTRDTLEPCKRDLDNGQAARELHGPASAANAEPQIEMSTRARVMRWDFRMGLVLLSVVCVVVGV